MRGFELNIGTELFALLLIALFLLAGPSFCGGCRASCGCNDQEISSSVVDQKSGTTTSSVSITSVTESL
jgi:hypothetical protein